MLERRKAMVQGLCEDCNAELIESNSAALHVHRLLGLNPECAPSIMANHCKTVTSGLPRKKIDAVLQPACAAFVTYVADKAYVTVQFDCMDPDRDRHIPLKCAGS
jgi:REP element-mobilizing transposase RayT